MAASNKGFDRHNLPRGYCRKSVEALTATVCKTTSDTCSVIGFNLRGLPIAAFITIKSFGHRCDRIRSLLFESPEVEACYRVIGSDHYLVKVAVTSMGHLEQIEIIRAVSTLLDVHLGLPRLHVVPKLNPQEVKQLKHHAF